MTSKFADRCFAFDQFGPLSIRPAHGASWARQNKPSRLPATYHRTHGIRYFHGCYCLGDDQLWGVTRRRKGGDHTLAALKSIRAARPGRYRLFVIAATCGQTRPPPSAPGQGAPMWNCASRPPAHRGPTRSRLSSGPCGLSSWATPATRTTWCSPAACRTTCAGATPTPATPTSWPPSAASEPASAANASNAGDDPGPKPHDQNRRTFMDTALEMGTAGSARGPRKRAGSNPGTALRAYSARAVARRAVPALADSVHDHDANREFVRRRGLYRQDLPGSGGAAGGLRGRPARDLWAVALRSRTPPRSPAPLPAGRQHRPQRSRSAAPARMAGPSSGRRAVSYRERSTSAAGRLPLRHCPGGQDPSRAPSASATPIFDS